MELDRNFKLYGQGLRKGAAQLTRKSLVLRAENRVEAVKIREVLFQNPYLRNFLIALVLLFGGFFTN